MLSERPDVVRWGDVPLDMTSIVGRFKRSAFNAFNAFYTDPERGMAVGHWEVEEGYEDYGMFSQTEVLYIVEGAATVQTDEGEQAVGPGDMVFTHPGRRLRLVGSETVADETMEACAALLNIGWQVGAKCMDRMPKCSKRSPGRPSADAGGDLAFVEVVPGAQAVRRPQADYLIHTNHCVCEETGARQPAIDEPTPFGLSGLRVNSRARYRTLVQIAPEAPRTRAGMEALLRDRSVPGGEISQTGSAGLTTVCAMVVAPSKKKWGEVEGFPPQVPFAACGV